MNRPMLRNGRHAWARTGVAITLIAASLTSAPSQASGDDGAAAEIAVLGAARSPVAPGALAVADISVSNRGDGSTGTPVAIDFATPVGVTIVSFEDADDAWSCAPADSTTTCTLVDLVSPTPVALDPHDTATGVLTIAVDPAVTPGEAIRIPATATAPGHGITPDLSDASADINFAPMGADQAFALDIDTDFVGISFPGEADTVTTRVRSLGPAILGGPGSSVSIDGVLPPGSTAWAASGDGWTCAPRTAMPSCAWTGADTPAGTWLPPIVVDYTAPRALTPAGAPSTWTRQIVATTQSGASVSAATDMFGAVIAPPAPDVGVSPGVATPGALEAPDDFVVDLAVTATNLLQRDADVVVEAELPAGVEFVDVTSEDPWICDPGSTPLTCRRHADFGGDPVSHLSIRLHATTAVAAGPTSIPLTVHAPGESSTTLADNAGTVAVQFDRPPPPGAALQLWQYDEAGEPVPTDGSPVVIPVGASGSFGVDARNDGSSPIPPGSRFTLTVDVPSEVEVQTADGAWDCTDGGAQNASRTMPRRGDRRNDVPWRNGPTATGTGELWCTLVTEGSIDLDGLLPRLRVEVTAPEATDSGPIDLPISLTADFDPTLRSDAVVPVTVLAADEPEPARGVVVDAVIDRDPRVDGRTGVLRITIANHSDGTARRATVDTELPAGVTATNLPRGCSTSRSGNGPDVRCEHRGVIQPGQSFDPLILELEATTPPTPKPRARPAVPSWLLPRLPAWLIPFLSTWLAPGSDAPTEASVGGLVEVDVQITPRGLTDRVSTSVDLAVLPALDARASALPAQVTNLPSGTPQPRVVLDGRSSDSVDATHTWRQDVRGSEPRVSFPSDADGDGRVATPTATFRAPLVTDTTTMHFVLDVSDDWTTSSTTVAVTVEPVPVAGPGDASGWEDQVPPSAPSDRPSAITSSPAPRVPAARSTLVSSGPSARQASLAAVDPWWRWTADPAVHRYFEHVVLGSRLTLVDNGDIAFQGPGAPPATEQVHHEWLLCDADAGSGYDEATCDIGGTEESFLPREIGRVVVLRMHVEGERSDETLSTTEDFVVGSVNVDGDRPHNFEPPQILGELVGGRQLTADPGAWNLENFLAIEWQRCGTDAVETCVPQANGPTYTTSAADLGKHLRLQVTSYAVGPTGAIATRSETVTSEVVGPVVAPALTVSTDLEAGAASVPNASSVRIVATTSGGLDDVGYEWIQTAGTDVLSGPVSGAQLDFVTPPVGSGDLTFSVTATDGAGTTASTTVVVTFGEVSAPGMRCELFDAARAADGGPATFALGSTFVLRFANAVLSSGSCSETTSFVLEDASLDLFEWLRIEGLDIHVDAGGLTLEGGTLRAPGDDALDGMDFRVVSSGMFIPFDDDAAALTIDGSVIADRLGFLDLPGGWDAAAQLGFATQDGEQTISFGAVAWDGSDGVEQSVDALPVPDPDLPHLVLSGTVSTDRSFDLTIDATGFIAVGAAAIDLRGDVARAGDGDIEITASGELAAPVALGDGISLDAADLAWDGETYTGTGALSIDVNGSTLRLGADFEFADPSLLSASLSLTSGDSAWTPLPGLALTDLVLTGSVVRTNGATAVDVEVAASEISFGPALTLGDFRLVIEVGCDPACEVATSVEADALVEVGATQTSAALEGTIDVATGAFALEATVSDLRPVEGLDIDDVSLTISGGAGETTSVAFAGTAVVFGSPVEVLIDVSADGYLLAARLGDWQPTSGAPRFHDAQVVYADHDASVMIAGESVDIAADTVSLAASTTAPRWLVDQVGDPGSASVVGDVDLATGDFDLDIAFSLTQPQRLFDIAGVYLEIQGLTLRVASAGGAISTSLSAAAVLGLPAVDSGGPASTVAVTFTAHYNPVTGLAGVVSVDGDWRDAFGVPNLTVTDLSVGFQLGGAPGLQLSGAVTLPPTWADSIGIASEAAIALTAVISGPTSCFEIEIGNEGSTDTVIDLGNVGAVTARHARLVVAPVGCTIGDTTLDPGLALAFDGSVLGAQVAMAAAVRPTPLHLDASVTLEHPIQVGGFELRDAALEVSISPQSQDVSFRAAADVFGASAEVAGRFARTPGGTAIDLEGSFAAPDLGGFRLDELAVTLHVEQTATSTSVEASASAAIAILGAPQQVAFAFEVDNGVVRRATATADVHIPLGAVTIDGRGTFEFRIGEFPTIEIAGSLIAAGHTLSDMAAVLSPGGLHLEATLGSLGSAVPPRLSGTIAWSSDGATDFIIENQAGDEVVAQPGDFRFSAQDVRLRAAGFSLGLDLSIGKVGGVVWSELATEINLGQRFAVYGSFASNGDFTLTGSQSIELNGFQLPEATFTVSRLGGAFTVSGQVEWAIPKLSTVELEGTFTWTNVYGLSYNLRGTGLVNPGGYAFGEGNFRLWRKVGVSEGGLLATFTIRFPGFADATATMRILNNENLEVSAKTTVNGALGTALGNPTANLYYFNRPNLDRLQIDASLTKVLGLPAGVYIAGILWPGNNFTLKASAGFDARGGPKDVFICDASYRVWGSFAGRLDGTAHSFTLGSEFDLGVSGKCGSISLGLGAHGSLSYQSPATFKGSLKVSIDYGVDTWNPTVFTFST